MITILRFLLLVIFFLYSCALLASILHAYNHWGYMSLGDVNWEEYFSFSKWPAIILGASIVILSTPIGDFFIGLCLPTRKQALREERKIAPTLALLKEAYREKYGQNLRPKAYVMDLPNIDGLTFGRRTIAVSSGLLKVASDEEIAAVFAHEIGHLHHRDGFFNVALFVASVPTMVISIFLCSIYIVTFLIGLLVFASFAPVLALLSVAGAVLIFLRSVLEEFIKWPAEYKADRFAAQMGFAPALISLFERIEDEDVRGEGGFLAKYDYSHPPTALRIDRLERYMLCKS